MKKMKYISLWIGLCYWSLGLTQSDSIWQQMRLVRIVDDTIEHVIVDGISYTALISGEDTIIMADISEVRISSPRHFATAEDYRRYMKYRRYAVKVYPYAKEAIRIFKEAEYVTTTMKKRKRKKYMKKLAKDLEREFEVPLRHLSKTQGKIMVKMIERELDKPMFDLIKMTRGRFKAVYWNHFSKLYGYRLKWGYVPGDNPILDIVLQDFDISHEIVEN